MNGLAQVLAVSRISLMTIGQRLGPSASAMFGIAGVVAVLVGVLSIAQGFRKTMTAESSDDTAVVLRSGADTELTSGLSREDTRIVADAPGVARGAEGALASAELFVIINLPKRSTGTDANVPVRGVEPPAFAVRGQIEIAGGRMFEWGRNEVIVGTGAAIEFAGLEIGDLIPVGASDWEVVGHFTAGGGISESEVWTDAAVLQPAYRRGDSFQSVYARLESAAAFTEFKDALTADPRVTVKVERQSEYFEGQTELIDRIITTLGGVIAGLMGIGAVFGALNTMYNAVSARTREIATLRALGFHGAPVIASVLCEALVIAIVGGAAGAGLAWLAFDGYRAATINWASFSQVAFAFEVTPGLLVRGVLYATVIGLIGGLFPAIRAARMPIATALRES